MRPEQLLRFSDKAAYKRDGNQKRFNEAGAAAPVFRGQVDGVVRNRAASMRPEQLLRFSLVMHVQIPRH